MIADLITCSFCCIIIGFLFGFGVAGNEYEKDLKSYKKRFENIEETARKGLSGECDRDSAFIFIECESDLNLPNGHCSMKGSK